MSNSYVKAIEALNKLQSNADYIRQAKAQKNNAQSNMAEMIKFLTRLSISLEELDTLPVIHIAGTNGKGSTSSYCEAILRKHGYKTGFYSSPHLLEVRERIRLNGIPLSQELFADHFWQIYNKLDEKKATSTDMPLYFRFLTLMAFQVFLTEKVDVAILEVGIGGEFDCTNIIRYRLYKTKSVTRHSIDAKMSQKFMNIKSKQISYGQFNRKLGYKLCVKKTFTFTTL